MGSALPVSGKMVLVILLLSLVLTKTGTDAKSSLGLEDLENLVKQMELKMKDMEAKNKEMETRLEELEEQLKECHGGLGKIDSDPETSKSEQKRGAENSSTKDFASSYPHNALTKPSLRDLPIILISAWRGSYIHFPQTVTFDSFLANYNNGDTPGGGDGKLDLDSGVFTCLTPGYYTVSYSAYGRVGPTSGIISMYLYKNGLEIFESLWHFWANSDALNNNAGVVGSRIVIIHMDAGDTLELKMTLGEWIASITLNIELSG